MRLLRYGLAFILGLGLAGFAMAQAPPASCEQRLEEAQASLLQLRKRVAQAEFQAAAIEEIAVSCQKKVSEAETKPHASRVPEKK